jgi:hypothetical protein
VFLFSTHDIEKMHSHKIINIYLYENILKYIMYNNNNYFLYTWVILILSILEEIIIKNKEYYFWGFDISICLNIVSKQFNIHLNLQNYFFFFKSNSNKVYNRYIKPSLLFPIIFLIRDFTIKLLKNHKTI